MLKIEGSSTSPSVDRGVEIKSLADLWMHQNTLMWSRVQLLSALQAAVLASNYVLHNGMASVFLFITATIATLYLNYIWEVDREIRNSYNVRLRQLGFKIGLTPEERRAMRVSIMGLPMPAHLHAQISLTAIFWGMLAVDAVVFVASAIVFPFRPN